VEGGCSCGAVRYRLTTEPLVVHCCHCPECEVAVFSEYGRPEVRFVRAGTLDDPAAVAPDVHIYTRSKVPWVTLPPSVPAFDVYYDSKTLWPPEKLERLRAAFRASPA
jgi:hypothetical protein